MSAETEFTPVPKHINLDNVCVLKEYRKIRNDHTFSYGNKFYLIDSPLKYSIAKQKIEIRKCNCAAADIPESAMDRYNA